MSRRRLIVTLLATTIVLIGLDQLARAGRNGDGGGIPEAEWIWASQTGVSGSPMAFYAVKEFDLRLLPTDADLRIIADEEYQLTVNGRGVAAGRFRSGNGPDAFAIESLLRSGKNRIIVELRSARGAGGLLFGLAVRAWDDSEQTIVSDASWRIHRVFGRSSTGVPDPGEPPIVWGSEPVGRWGTLDQAAPAKTLRMLQVGAPRHPRPAIARRYNRGAWQRPIDIEAGVPLGPWVTWDFGQERTGFLNLKFASSAGGPGYVFYSRRRPSDGIADPDEILVRAAGRNNWIAASPVTFRYATVVGAPEISGAEVVPINPHTADQLSARQPVDALFGVDRSLVTPVEDEIRRQLKRVPGLARREEG